ncbi:MAG: hypothetical protein ACT4PK_09460, partial [Gammaproteobacteria bacterium]
MPAFARAARLTLLGLALAAVPLDRAPAQPELGDPPAGLTRYVWFNLTATSKTYKKGDYDEWTGVKDVDVRDFTIYYCILDGPAALGDDKHKVVFKQCDPYKYPDYDRLNPIIDVTTGVYTLSPGTRDMAKAVFEAANYRRHEGRDMWGNHWVENTRFIKRAHLALDAAGEYVFVAVTPAAPRAVVSGFEVGDRVQCNWKEQGTYYPGVIARRDGDQVLVHYDDGDKEQTLLTQCRGDLRVQCNWKGHGQYYPGVIAGRDGD